MINSIKNNPIATTMWLIMVAAVITVSAITYKKVEKVIETAEAAPLSMVCDNLGGSWIAFRQYACLIIVDNRIREIPLTKLYQEQKRIVGDSL